MKLKQLIKQLFVKFARLAPMVILFIILAGSLWLNTWNRDMGWHHPDEMKKIGFILENRHDFHHPALMTEVPKFINRFTNYTTKNDVGILGRTTTAVFGMLIVLFSYLIIRSVAGVWLSLIVAFSIAVSPILVIHSHYLKEDIIFTCFALFAMWMQLRFVKKSNLVNGLFLGLAFGLAFSSHYKGILVFVLSLFIPLIVDVTEKKKYYLFLFLSWMIAIVVTLGINYLFFSNVPFALAGIRHTTHHIIIGNVINIYPLPHFFSWHFIHSILPGMTPPMAFIAFVMLLLSLWKWKKLSDEERVFIVFTLIYYFAAESTPLKAFPDYMRYIIPVIPGLVYLACKAGWLLLNKTKGKASFWILLIMYAMILLYPLYDTVQLVYNLKGDTRERAIEWISKTPEKLMVENYVFLYKIINSITEHEIEHWQIAGYKYLVASSFQYDRYLYGATLKYQDASVYEIARKYQRFFNEYPYREIKPRYRTFAFSNPTIRIIDIRPESRKIISK